MDSMDSTLFLLLKAIQMVIEILIWTVGLYLLCGLVFAVPFLIRGVLVIDEGTAGTKWGFRLIILPGTVILWPFLLRKWLIISKEHSND